MIKNIGNGPLDLGQLERDLKRLSKSPEVDGAQKPDSGFLEMLKSGIGEVNQTIQASEKASMDLASGKDTNLHETMLSITKAEIAFNMLVQIRNKAIEAYQEVSKMQV